tara:strand:+ start:3315 stop:4955 length:1641 start_codon:yes stop_codon:yes gene_type:complete
MWSFFGYKDEKKDNDNDKEEYEEQTIKTYTHHGSHPPSNFVPSPEYMRTNYSQYIQPIQHMQAMPSMVYIDPSQYNNNKRNISHGISSDDEDEEHRIREETSDFDTEFLKKFEPEEINSKDLFLKTYNIEDIDTKETFIDVIPEFPKTLDIDSEIEFMELRSWFYNTTDLLNIWHIHNKKSKLDYANAMKYLSFKLKEIVLYYYDYRVDYNDVNEGIQRGDKHIGDKIDSKYIKKKLFYFKNSGEDHIQSLLDNYPTRFYRDIPDEHKEFYEEQSKCCLMCNKITFNEIDSIKYSIDKMQLTEEQYNIFKNEYLSKLKYLERRKKKFKKLFCFSNTSLQLGSVILPTLITIKDNINIHDVPELKKTLDVSAIILSVVMGIITNLTVFFKVNQRYSLYTQYDNKLKQEMRRFITYSEKYNDNDVKDTHRLFPQFSVAIENYIEELSNQEYDYIVGNKEKDMSAFAKKDEIYNRGNVNREIVISDKPKRKPPKERGNNIQPPTPHPKKERAPDEKSTDEEDKNSEDKVFDDDKEIIEESKNKDGEKNN